jgi:hypothetical protein
MAGIEMENALLIGLGLLLVVIMVYQYNPSFFPFMKRGEGFVSPSATGSATDSASGSTTGNHDKPLTPEEKAKKEKEDKDKAKADADKAALAMTPAEKAAAAAAAAGKGAAENFADLGSYEGPAKFGSAEAPAGCYPRDQLTPAELLPKDMNSIWAEQNPMGPGSLKGKNFLSAGALIGVNTVGQSLRNANLQIRSEPPNPQVPVSIFLQSTIGPDISHRSLEIN